MRKRIMIIAVGLLLAVGALAGCGAGQEAGDTAAVENAEVASLRAPMAAAIIALDQLNGRLRAGNLTDGRESYKSFANAFGQVLAPVSFRDSNLAKEMALANIDLRDELTQPKPNVAAVDKHVGVLSRTLSRVAQALGIAPITTAAAHVGATSVTLNVQAKEYQFMPLSLEVKKGTRVTIMFKNVGTEKHEFELDAFDQEVRPVSPGQTGQVTFVADKAGRFEYACHIDGHYQEGMKGTLIVR